MNLVVQYNAIATAVPAVVENSLATKLLPLTGATSDGFGITGSAMNYPYENLLIKVVDVLAKGIGTGARPLFIRWEARENALADAETLRIGRLAQEQVRQVVEDVRAGKVSIADDLKLIEHSSGSNSSDEQKIGEVKKRYIEALNAADMLPHRLVEIERRLNLDQIAVMAMQEAQADENDTVDEKPVDPDWFSQWRNRAQDVANEDMQRLWAKVLKGEAQTSGKFSIHTMDFLARMSRSEAEMIASLGSFVFEHGSIFAASHDPEYLKHEFPFGKLLELNDLGIISGVAGFPGQIQRSINVSEQADGSRTAVALCGEKALIFYVKDPSVIKLEIPGYPLTVVGKQLLSLAAVKANQAACEALAHHHKAKCSKVIFANFTEHGGGTIEVADAIVLWQEPTEEVASETKDQQN